MISSLAAVCHSGKDVTIQSKDKSKHHCDLNDDNQTTVSASSATTVPTNNRTNRSFQQSSKRTVTPEGKADTMADRYATIDDFVRALSREGAPALLENETNLVLFIRDRVAARVLPIGNEAIVWEYREAMARVFNIAPPSTIQQFVQSLSRKYAQALLRDEAILVIAVRNSVAATAGLQQQYIVDQYRGAMRTLLDPMEEVCDGDNMSVSASSLSTAGGSTERMSFSGGSNESMSFSGGTNESTSSSGGTSASTG